MKLLKPICVWLLAISIFQTLQAQSSLAIKPNAFYRLKELSDSFGKINYHHSFTYDEQGRPLYHVYKYSLKGKLISSDTYKYVYDATGKLTSQNSDKLHYNYFYDNGSLNKITSEIIYKNKWELCEETLLVENETGNQKKLHLKINKRKLVNGVFDSLRNYCDIEYTMDSGNNILKSTVFANDYFPLKEPLFYTFSFDNKPNPLQNIFIERWYQFDIENGGLTNVSKIKRGNDIFTTNKIYTYNEAGYPITCLTNNYKFKTFAYELVEAPLPKQVIQKTTSFKKQSILIYPNPASINFIVKADGLNQGQAILRIFELSTGRMSKQVTYNVYNKLEALITTNECLRAHIL